MQAFLEQVAKYIKDHHKAELKDQLLVFTNRRASLFFNKYLKRNFNQPEWSPQTITISELFEKFTKGRKTDKLILLFELYQSYCYILKTNEPFDQFYFWGNMMLRDFDEIDKYMIPPKMIFSNIKAHKEIEQEIDYLEEEQKEYLVNFWKVFEESKISEEKERFISIWDKLYDIYEDFNKRCDDKHYFYEGKLYKTLINNLSNQDLKASFPYIHFVGFNALNQCEKKLFSHFKKASTARFYWDYDLYYLEKTFHEAGKFMRVNLEMFPAPKDFVIKSNIEDRINKEALNIDVYSVGLEIGQAIKCGDLLQANNIDCSQEQTAIILPDEHLLMPVLQSLPNETDKVNISMGYSFKETPLFALFDNIMLLQNEKSNSSSFHYKPSLAILNHPYINDRSEDHNSVIESIVKHNVLWLGKKHVPNSILCKHIFRKLKGHLEFNEYILQLLFNLYNKFKQTAGNQLEQEFIYHTYLQVQKINESIKDLALEIDLGTYLKLFKQILNDISVPFIGEPLDGLQVMGVLETRSLDFKNVFILSLNEGKMPAKQGENSFIPYAMRKGYGLPTTEEFDAVYAYYFYRLIQRADNVYLFHNNIQEGDVKSEKSRFLYQLEYELNKKGAIKTFVQKNDYIQSKDLEIEIDTVLIEKYFNRFKVNGDGVVEKYLTPSAINKFIDCPLSFYFRYILKLYPNDEITEDIDHASFGNILHQVMEELYDDYIKSNTRRITAAAIDQILKVVEVKTDDAIKENTGIETHEIEGDIYVVKHIIIKYVKAILAQDKLRAPFDILGLETDQTDAYRMITANGYGIEGKIDRIDLKDNVVRIVDYKTGAVNYDVKSIEGLLNDEKSGNKYAVQAFLYAALFQSKYQDQYPSIQPTIIGVKELYDKNPTDGKFNYKGEESIISKGLIENYSAFHQQWINIVDQKLHAIASGRQPIIQTEDLRKCDFCDYQSRCNK